MSVNADVVNDESQDQDVNNAPDNNDQNSGSNAPDVQILTPEILAELEQLREFRKGIEQKEPDKTPEQVAKEAALDNQRFRTFAIENDLLKEDDFSKKETFSKKQDRDLVFENYSKEYLEENPDADDDDVREAFELQYHIDSTNEALRKRGEKLLQKEASEIRNPLESSFTNAKSKYDENVLVERSIPEYNKFMDALIDKTVQNSLEHKFKSGDDEVPVNVQLTEDERKEIISEIEKEIKNNHTVFYSFLKETKEGQNDFIQKLVSDRSNLLFYNKVYPKMMSAIASAAEGIGVKKGSNVGAEQPFGLVRTMNNQNNNARSTVQESDLALRDKIANFR